MFELLKCLQFVDQIVYGVLFDEIIDGYGSHEEGD